MVKKTQTAKKKSNSEKKNSEKKMTDDAMDPSLVEYLRVVRDTSHEHNIEVSPAS